MRIIISIPGRFIESAAIRKTVRLFLNKNRFNNSHVFYYLMSGSEWGKFLVSELDYPVSNSKIIYYNSFESNNVESSLNNILYDHGVQKYSPDILINIDSLSFDGGLNIKNTCSLCFNVIVSLDCHTRLTDGFSIPFEKFFDYQKADQIIFLGQINYNPKPNDETYYPSKEDAFLENVYIGDAESIIYNCFNQNNNREYNRRRIAIATPVPGQKTGIADYSAELIRYLSKYFIIHIISEADKTEDQWLSENFELISPLDFLKNRDFYDEVLYNFGNSPFHVFMWDLIRIVPGVVILHDFYLSGALFCREDSNVELYAMKKGFYDSHGYPALFEAANDQSAAAWKYPCNFEIISRATAVVVHSQHSANLIMKWWGVGSEKVSVVPHLRRIYDKGVYSEFNSPKKDQINTIHICSFGVLGETKMNMELLIAFANLKKKFSKIKLIFVGDIIDEYGVDLKEQINILRIEDVLITGWVSDEEFHKYLKLADISVQLRCNSRGETSGTVLYTLAYGIPTICNAHGSMAEFPSSVVYKIKNDFNSEDLTEALNTLIIDPDLRLKHSIESRDYIKKYNDPRAVARQYFDVVEQIHIKSSSGLRAVFKEINTSMPFDANIYTSLAKAVAPALLSRRSENRVFLDVSAIIKNDTGTGIQRVTKSLLAEFLSQSWDGFRYEPVYIKEGMISYHYARNFATSLLKIDKYGLADEPLDIMPGDIFFGLDFSGHEVIKQAHVLKSMQLQGVNCYFLVHDILPATNPEWFPDEFAKSFVDWLKVVSSLDGVISVSNATNNRVIEWRTKNNFIQKFSTLVSHNGSEFSNFYSDASVKDVFEKKSWISRNYYLMVGTIEPRKGHADTLDAFDELWSKGQDLCLVLVGKKGWLVDDLIHRIKTHPDFGRKLLWADDITDSELTVLYQNTLAVIAASYDEGFGLPLVEANHFGVPVIVRDIEVFREVLGDSGIYFNDKNELISIINRESIALPEKRLPRSWKSMAFDVHNWFLSLK